MAHFYEKNIVEIKNEYTTFLTNVLIPLIYEGIQSTYNYAVELHKKMEDQANFNRSAKNPGIIKIFQMCLKEISALSASAIANEVARIKEFSRCSEWFDDLVKSVIKSYIILLTYNSSGKTCNLITNKYHEKININEFIHKCYIECSIVFFNNPEIFWPGHSKDTKREYKLLAFKYIKQAIHDAIHQMLPIKLILQEYLSHDYIVGPSGYSGQSGQSGPDGHHEQQCEDIPDNERNISSMKYQNEIFDNTKNNIFLPTQEQQKIQIPDKPLIENDNLKQDENIPPKNQFCVLDKDYDNLKNGIDADGNPQCNNNVILHPKPDTNEPKNEPKNILLESDKIKVIHEKEEQNNDLIKNISAIDKSLLSAENKLLNDNFKIIDKGLQHHDKTNHDSPNKDENVISSIFGGKGMGLSSLWKAPEQKTDDFGGKKILVNKLSPTKYANRESFNHTGGSVAPRTNIPGGSIDKYFDGLL